MTEGADALTTQAAQSDWFKLAEVTQIANGTSMTVNVPNAGLYKFLEVVWSAYNATGGSVNARMQLNGDTGAAYQDQETYAIGTTTGSDRQTNAFWRIGEMSSIQGLPGFGKVRINLPGATNVRKCFFSEAMGVYTGQGSVRTQMAGYWDSFAAITQIAMLPGDGAFGPGSYMTVYGIK